MKKVVCGLMAVCGAMTVIAEPFFSIVNTVKYGKDSSPSDAHASYYSGYLCTVESAQELFGGRTTAAGMTDYVLAHYESVLENIETESVLKLSADAEGYSFGQYAVSAYSGTALPDVGYLALLLYSDGVNEAFRAYGLGSADADNGSVTFDDNGSSAATALVGAWTVTVPEPTSGILLLVGLAGLALKRKCNKAADRSC